MLEDVIDESLNENYRPVYATFLQRLGAFFLDAFIVNLPLTFLTFYGLLTSNMNYIILSIVMLTLYKILTEGTFGSTLGKHILRIRMVDDSGQTIDMNQSVLKNMIYLIQNSLSILSFQYIQSQLTLEEDDQMINMINQMNAMTDNPYNISSQFITFLILVSCTSILFNPITKQTIHDKLANVFCIDVDASRLD